MRRGEAMRMAAAHRCVVATDRRAMSTALKSRQRKPQRVLVAGEPAFIHRRKDGAQGWCGLDVCFLSEEAWTTRDSLGAHAKLLAQVQPHTGEARNQRRNIRNRDRYTTLAEPD